MRFLGAGARAVLFCLCCGSARAAASAETVYWVDQHNGKLQRLEPSTGEVQDVLTNPVVMPRDIAFDLDSGKMYWVDSEAFKIQRANLDGSEVEDLVFGSDFSRPNFVVVDAASQTMFWAQGDAVRRADTDGTDVSDLVTGQLRPAGLALDAAAGKLYWNDDFGNIQRANLDGSDHQVLVPTAAFVVTPVQLDVSRGKMYWSAFDLGFPGKIQRANLDGSALEDIVDLSSFPIQQLIVDSDSQKIYWSTFSPTPAIRRANLDGSNVEAVLTSGIVLSRSFAVDSAGGKVYWTEEQGSKIRRADLSGANVEDLVREGIAFPEGIRLDLSAGKMYWTDVFRGTIQRADLSGSNAEDLVVRIFRATGGAAIDRGERKIYWVERSTGIHRVGLDGAGFESLVREGPNSAQGIALDLSSRKMYWTSSGEAPVSGKIRRANLDGSEIEDLVLTGFTALRDIALDVARGKMYWSEILPSRIRRANLDGSQAEDAIVTTGLDVHGLAIDPLIGRVYWGETIASPGFGLLRRANLDGTDPRTLRSSFASAITLDPLSRKVYWAGASGGEFGNSLIARANLDGSGSELLLSGSADGLGTPTGIALDFEESPLSGTGFALDNPAAGLGAFLRITSTTPALEVEGPVRPDPSALKDIARDPTTGVLYTIDLTSGPQGQRVYRKIPGGPWTPLPSATGVPAPGLIWGLAFDGQGSLFGAGLGVYNLDKHTGQAFLLAGVATTPAFVFGMAAAPNGIGFLSTGLLLTPGGPRPYVGRHAPDGSFVPDGIFFPLDASGEERALFDIAWSDERLLYGIAWPSGAFGSADAGIAGRVLKQAADADARSDLVLLSLTRLGGTPVAVLSAGAPLKAVVFGLGENVP